MSARSSAPSGSRSSSELFGVNRLDRRPSGPAVLLFRQDRRSERTAVVLIPGPPGRYEIVPPDALTPIRATRMVTRPSAPPGSFLRKGGIHTMSFLHALIASFRRDEEGQGLAEYALILALIAIVAIIALIFLGNQVSTILSTVGKSI